MKSKAMSQIRRAYYAAALAGVGFLVQAQVAMAQGGGALQKIRQATDQTSADLRGIVDPIITILMVITGIIGIVQIIPVARKFMAGDQDAGKKLAQWVAGLVLVFVLLGVAKAVFF